MRHIQRQQLIYVTGTIKKTFKITPHSLKNNTQGYFENHAGNIEAVYEKGGAKPKVIVSFRNTVLTEGKDYTLSYKNHTAVNALDNPSKIPTITIKGKGNFKDSAVKEFKVIPAQLSTNGAIIQVKDVVYKNKQKAYISKQVITDSNGKKLSAGSDYNKNVEYFYDSVDGQPVAATDIPAAGSVIYAKVTGIKNYTGTIGASYRIVDKSISSAKVKVAPQEYTGNPVTITQEDITAITVGKTVLTPKDYEIVEGSYVNNIKKGTAKVTIRGIGEYGCEKQISFSIQARPIG